MASSYTYTALKSPNSIRLLVLHPAARVHTPLECQLIEAQLDDGCEFEALSYTWNQETPSMPIVHLDQASGGKGIVLVTPNCEQALRRLRRMLTPRMLWIDAICIDQQNIPEKNQQVKMMAAIYATATRVLIWLGEPDVDMAKAFRALKRMVRAFSAWNLVASKSAVFLLLALLHVQAFKKKSFHPRRTSAFYIFSSRWFTRMWTLQEAAMAKRCQIICGTDTFQWSDIERSVEHLLSRRSRSANNLVHAKPSAAKLAQIVQLADEEGLIQLGTSIAWRNLQLWGGVPGLWSKAQKQTFIDASVNLKSRQCLDPRDKVFAMYSLYHAAGVSIPDPDYALPVATVYQEAVASIISSTKSLDILYSAGLDHQDCKFKLQSWVLDWSLPTTPQISSKVNYESSASKHVDANYPFNQHKSALRLKGVIVDTIKVAVRAEDPVEIGRKLSPRWENASMDQQALIRDIANIRLLKHWFKEAIIRHDNDRQNYAALFDILDEAPENVDHALNSWANILLDEGPCCQPPDRLHPNSDPYHLLTAQTIYSSADPDDATILSPQERQKLEAMITKSYIRDLNVVENWSRPNIMSTIVKMPEFRTLEHLERHGFRYKIKTCHLDCQLVQTEEQRVGQGPRGCQPEDVVAIVAGLSLPLVLRPHGLSFSLVGPIYLAGAMRGELWPDDPADLRDIVLV